MSIVSSTYEFVEPNADSSKPRWVRETHTSSTGEKHISTYLGQPGADYQATANARAAQVAEDFAVQEASGVLNG